MANNIRTLNVKQESGDLRMLNENGYRLQIAHGINDSRGNVVWKSLPVAPRSRVNWKPIYGLNFTDDQPQPGQRIIVGGEWQPCDIGGALDLTPDGYWQRSGGGGRPGSIGVGQMQYDSRGGGIHIVVGIQDPYSGEFEPIFVDPSQIRQGMRVSYRPQETLQWWYGSRDGPGTFFRDPQGQSEYGNFDEAPFSKTATFSADGRWETSSP